MTRFLLAGVKGFILLSFVSVAAPAHAQTPAPQPEAVVDLAEDFIPVTEDFDGAKMTVFGALRASKSDIIVVFEGPAAKALVREKVKKMGIWINGEPQTLSPVPSYYAVLSSRPLDKMLKPERIEELGLGLNVGLLKSEAGQGLVQNRVAKGLYIEDSGAVKIRDRKLFRADIQMPPNVPVGTYKATIYEVKGGAVSASRETTFKVETIGMASMIRRLAFDYPVFYAMLAIGSVLLIGGFAAHLFRKAA